jgi:NADH:ubiquinone reductase (non-electrogenic)
MNKFPETQTNRRGITVDDHLRMKGAEDSIFALGDCTATSYAPTAQVASQQGAYLGRVLAQIARKDGLEAELKKLEVVKAQIGASQPEEDKQKLEKDIEGIKRKIANFKPRPFDYSHQGTLACVALLFIDREGVVLTPLVATSDLTRPSPTSLS